jgi:hypothetical protein
MYKFSTDNLPPLDPLVKETPHYLKDWGQPSWSIYVMHDDSIEVHADRPSHAEIVEGDLHGSLGTQMVLSSAHRPFVRNALHLARKLCTCDPINGIVIPRRILIGIKEIRTCIPIYATCHLDSSPAAEQVETLY